MQHNFVNLDIDQRRNNMQVPSISPHSALHTVLSPFSDALLPFVRCALTLLLHAHYVRSFTFSR